jgi:hypothetical protein
METPLEELLNDTPAEPTIEAEAPREVERPRDENGRFAPKETGVEPAQVEEPAAEQVPPTSEGLPPETFKGLKEEREKRQNLERELQTLREQLQSLQQPQEPPAPPPSVWEDENAYGGHLVTTAVQQATFNARLDMSEMMVRQANPDFEDMKAKFLQLAELNPSLRQQALADPHPWNKAYQIAKNAAMVEELGTTDINALKAKLREEIAAEMQATQPARSTIPPTLTGERNVGARSGPAWSGPPSLSELLR